MPLTNTPRKMYIVDLGRPPHAPDNTLDAQFNPTEIEESLSVNWNKLAVLGLSHMPLQYQQTDNHGFSFELAFFATDDHGNKLDAIARARRFLLALCYPARDSKTGAPARALFCWPKLASLTSVLRKVSFKHTMFNEEGDPVVFTAKVTLEEIRDARLYADEVRSYGTIRSTGAVPSTGSNIVKARPHPKPRPPIAIVTSPPAYQGGGGFSGGHGAEGKW